MSSAEDRKSLYPLEPGFQNTDTSREAAEDITSHADVLRRKCLAVVRSAPQHDAGVLKADVSPVVKNTPSKNSQGQPVGITSHEAAGKLGEPHYNIHPRFSELRRAGLLRDSGVRRLNAHSGKKAICWVAGNDPDKPALQEDNAPPSKPAAKAAYVRGFAAAFYTAEAAGKNLTGPELMEALRRRMAELEPGNPDWAPE